MQNFGSKIYVEKFGSEAEFAPPTKLENPSLVESIHTEYLQAGAELIETNTFGANRLRLQNHSLETELKAINQAGVKIAKQALEKFSQKSMKTAWIAGSLGPLGLHSEPFGTLAHREAVSIYEEQASALEESEVDILVLETFTHLSQLEAAIEGVRKVSSKPIVAMLAVNDEGSSLLMEKPEVMIDRLNQTSADVVGINCSPGPSIVLDVMEIFRARTKKLLASFPNAGLPKQVGGRYIYLSTPEYFGSFCKKFITLGVNLIGGCCGTTPTHIRRARDAMMAMRHSSRQVDGLRDIQPETPSVEAVAIEKRSRLSAKLTNGGFAISVEIDPPKGTKIDKAIEAAKQCYDAGIDCINIADGPRASARMNPLSMAVILERDVGIETIIHYCCRDRNILGMQSDLLGAHSLGLRNILCVTGDPPKLGDYPEAASVFDVDAIGLTKIVYRLNRGMDLAGNTIGEPTSFFQAVGCNPASLNFQEEMSRLKRKIEAGAEYILTQPVYDNATFERFLNAFEQWPKRPPLLIGICPLASLRNAEFLHNEVPGMQIPKSIMKRMAEPKTKEGQREEGIKIAQEALRAFRSVIQGTYIMPPFNRADIALQVVDEFI